MLNDIFLRAQNDAIEKKLREEHAPILKAIELASNILGDQYSINIHYSGYPKDEPKLWARIEYFFGPAPVGLMMSNDFRSARFSVNLKAEGSVDIDYDLKTTDIMQPANTQKFSSNKPIEVIASLIDWTNHQFGDRKLSPTDQAIIHDRLTQILSLAPNSSHLVEKTVQSQQLKIVR